MSIPPATYWPCLTSGSHLRGLLQSSSQPLLFLDARPGPSGRAAWLSEHVAGAVWIDLDTDLAAVSANAAVGGRHPLPRVEDWRRTVGRLGISPQTSVVVYDDAAGAMAAARAWWMLRALGHDAVSVLDGGLLAAREAGLEFESGEVWPRAAGDYPVLPRKQEPGQSGWLLPTSTLEQVNELRSDESWTVLDARSAERYAGLSEPFDPVKGHIPGAINLPYTEMLDSEGRFLAPAALRERLLAALGTGTNSRTIVHCGSGVTACHLVLASDAAGLGIPTLYVGSWSEWCRNPLPIAVGDSSGP